MPMMIDLPIKCLSTQLKAKRQSYYGHPKPFATRCRHTLHPSAPQHTPLCPTCIASQAKEKMHVALRHLIAKGGLSPAENQRDRTWMRAKLRYELAKRVQTDARVRDQLRLEREQVWDDAHAQFDSRRQQAAVIFQHSAECPVCALLVAPYPTNVTDGLKEMGTTWWEKPGGLVSNHVLVPRTPLGKQRQPRQQLRREIGSPFFREMIQDIRESLAASESHRQSWEIRYRTESAVRRKHNLGEDFQTKPEFWESPISGLICRQNYQNGLDNQRMAERRARGNRTRPRPPRSSLSYSESSTEVEVDESMLERMKREEELEELLREARKVGEEVGYLYFVGEIDGMAEWREDYLRSDRQLVYRETSPLAESVSEIGDSEDEGDEDDDDMNKMDVD